ncbi:MAG TPA: DNA topoisomerase 4 subunit A, partial [Candidatus Portnoybacteria bacterium]|nr:DNA topoisomerase 4 subunit A [Candidatus Portnoybacteria bacterium]
MDIGKIQQKRITEEIKEDYIDYAMSVIVRRALPDVRDGLKPVHRRILYAMHEMGLVPSAKFRKSATVVGEVLGKYHPHGDTAVYDTLVRMAQDFSLRYPLVHGQGNFGSIDGDPAAAQRYTEAKLSKIGEEMLKDIHKETVDFRDNYDASRQEPVVLPSPLPQLLLNGSMGIAVGMATNIPPHNLGEIVGAVIHLIEHPEATVEDLMQFIKGPDFPTGGLIYDRKAILQAYSTGRGPVVCRGRAEIVEDKKGRFQIIISEIPYQVNKSSLLEKIALLVKEKKLVEIKDARDESDKDGIRIVIDLKNDASPQKVLNRLYKLTELQTTFNFNMIALVGGIQPATLSLKSILEYYIEHRQDVITRRSQFELKKAKEREHILEGLKKALDHIDEIIKTIKKSATKEDAHKNLVKNFKLSVLQADAILVMKLQSLAGLERKKIEDELAEKRKIIAYLENLLAHTDKILKMVKDELTEIKEKYSDPRRTKVYVSPVGQLREEDLIPNEECIITLTFGGYIKRMNPKIYHQQRRGGRGVTGMAMREEDSVKIIRSVSTHDYLLFFTNFG